MDMLEYTRQVKVAFRDQLKLRPTGGTEDDPLFDNLPDGMYPVLINDKLDYVQITGGSINCCNFQKPRVYPPKRKNR